MTENSPLPFKADIHHIGVIMLAEIGDILVTTPTISNLKGLYPNSRITAIIRKPFADLLEHHPLVSDLILLDNTNFFTKIEFLKELNKQRFDLLVDLHTPTFNTCTTNDDVFKRNANVLRFTRARYRLGFERKTGKALITHSVPIPSDEQLSRENIVDTTLRLLGDSVNEPGKKDLYLSERAVSDSKKLLGQKSARLESVSFFFGSKQAADVWPIENVEEFTRKFLAMHKDFKLILLGGTQELGLANVLIDSLEPSLLNRVINLVAKTSLQQTAACIRASKCMVSTDSGPLHMADALGVPLVALFSSKNHIVVWEPVKSPATVLNKPVPCGPCFRQDCDYSNKCMAMITPAEVLQAVNRFIKQPVISE